MNRLFIVILQAGVLAASLFGLFGQILVIPNTAANEVEQFPPYAPFEAPYVTVAIAGVACVQVALVAAWMLLGLVRREAIFTPRAFRWVDTPIGASLVATLLAVGVTGHLALAQIPSPGDGMQVIGTVFAGLACIAAGTAFAMLMYVARGLLRKASALQSATAAAA